MTKPRSSGSTGIVGSADTAYVLIREGRAENTAKLVVTGRDVDYQEILLKFQDLRWNVIKRLNADELKKERIPSFLFQLVDFMKDHTEWSGSATELLAALGDMDTSPISAAKTIVRYYYEILYPAGIDFRQSRTSKARVLTFRKYDGYDGCDG